MKIDDDKKAEVIIDLLTDIQIQNRVLAEMVLPLYCEAKGLDRDTAMVGLNEFFSRKKEALGDYIYAQHGKISIEDILGKRI